MALTLRNVLLALFWLSLTAQVLPLEREANDIPLLVTCSRVCELVGVEYLMVLTPVPDMQFAGVQVGNAVPHST